MANQIVLTGRLVKDAELAYLPGTGMPKTTFTVATERNYQKDKNNKKVDFIPAEMIGKHVEKLAQYLTKGKQILVIGELNIDQYEKDGQKKSFTKVKVDKLEFLGGGSKETYPDLTGGINKYSSPDPTGRFKEVLDDEDLPF